MANIVFIALQCCQCSTMQVKQQKKSSNKWTCVVCNQKQSVLKVFARGFMAKDIRKFVQSFNMSRKFADESDKLTVDYKASFPEFDGQSAGIGEELVDVNKTKKRRVDWSEYMDGDDLRGDDIGAGVEGIYGAGGESEPKVVTEWPDELFKKPKPKSHSFSHDQSEASYKPVFSKRNRDLSCQGMDTRTQSRISKENMGGEGTIHERGDPFRNPKQTQNVQPAKLIPVPKFGASKWDQYITENEDNMLSKERSCDPERLIEGSVPERGNPVGNPNQSQKLQPFNSKPVSKVGASKWDQYITDNTRGGSWTVIPGILEDRNHGSTTPDDFGCRYEYDYEVEEDIHPDFL